MDWGDIDWSAWGAIGTWVGALATFVAAVMAMRALSTWREQLAGESQHDLAKRLCGALRKVQNARDATVHDLRWSADRSDIVHASLGSRSLPESTKVLEAAVQGLTELEGEVAVLWGEDVLALVVRIRSQSDALVKHVRAELAPMNDMGTIGTRIVNAALGIAPTFTRGSYQVGLDKLTALAQEWVAPYVGREGARRMSIDDFVGRKKQIDEDIKSMVDKEAAAVDQVEQEATPESEAAPEPGPVLGRRLERNKETE